MKNYKIEISRYGETISYEENGIKISFPKDESNSDYQAYLRHLAGEDDEAQSL